MKFMNRTSPQMPHLPRRSALLALASLHAILLATSSADTVAYWHFNSLSIPTELAPAAPTRPAEIAADVGTGQLNLTGWAGNLITFGGSTVSAQPGVAAGNALSFTPGPSPFPGNGTHFDFKLNLTSFSDPIVTFATRGTGTGFDTGTWSYSVASGPFVPIAGVNTATRSTTFGSQSVDLTAIDAVDFQANVVLRYTVSGATAANGNNRLDNVLVSATPLGDPPPTISTLAPANDATDVTLDSVAAGLKLTFSEDIILGEGVIQLMSGSTVVDSFDLSNFDQVDLNGPILTLKDIVPLAYSTNYWVKIPATAVDGFPGFSDDTGWSFTTAAAPAAPTVVVNKYANGTPDTVELLVIGNGTPGSTVNLQGMILKDFSGDVVGDVDNGGRYTFSDDAVWAAVPAGTLIVLTQDNATTDTDDDDFVMKVGLADTAYFTAAGSFNISNMDMVMMKAAGSATTGTTGGIHTLGGGPAGPQFTGFTGAKLKADTGGSGVTATNATSALADFMSGTGATGSVALTEANFGTANNGTNAAYIASLRGVNPANGDGIAMISNATAGSLYLGAPIFARGQTAQSLTVTLTAEVPSVTLSSATIEVPSALGIPTSVSLSGAGAGGATFLIVGQTVTISNAAATTSNSLVVTIGGLSTPAPSALTDTGAYSFAISTTGGGGTLAPIGLQPSAYVLIPMELVRDVDANGVALDIGAVVAVEGVSSMGNFSTANTQAYIQDSTAGINVFKATPGLSTPLVRGHRYAVLGTIQQFNGLTEIVPASEANVYDLGAATEPASQTFSTVAGLTAVAEAKEGSVVTLQNLYKVSGTWPNNQAGTNIVMRDAANNQITIRLNPVFPIIPEPSYPVTITGVLTQFDSSNPYTGDYQLFPRDAADFTAGTASDYDNWASGPSGAAGGSTADPDGDGKDNAFEYAFGLNASSGGSVNPFATSLSPATAKFSYTRRLQAQTGLTYKVFTSTTLEAASWIQDTTATQTVVGKSGEVETVEVTLSSPAPLTAPKLFLRVVAE